MLKEFKDVFETPTTFFKNEHKFSTGFILFLIAAVVNAVMTEILIQTRFVDFGYILDPYFAVTMKIMLSIAGFLVISTVCLLLLRIFNATSLRKFYSVSAYSLSVLIFLWIPHVLVAAIVFTWFIMLMIFGMKQYNSVTYKKGVVVAVAFVVITIALAFIVQNYIPIFPYKLA